MALLLHGGNAVHRVADGAAFAAAHAFLATAAPPASLWVALQEASSHALLPRWCLPLLVALAAERGADIHVAAVYAAGDAVAALEVPLEAAGALRFAWADALNVHYTAARSGLAVTPPAAVAAAFCGQSSPALSLPQFEATIRELIPAGQLSRVDRLVLGETFRGLFSALQRRDALYAAPGGASAEGSSVTTVPAAELAAAFCLFAGGPKSAKLAEAWAAMHAAAAATGAAPGATTEPGEARLGRRDLWRLLRTFLTSLWLMSSSAAGGEGEGEAWYDAPLALHASLPASLYEAIDDEALDAVSKVMDAVAEAGGLGPSAGAALPDVSFNEFAAAYNDCLYQQGLSWLELLTLAKWPSPALAGEAVDGAVTAAAALAPASPSPRSPAAATLSASVGSPKGASPPRAPPAAAATAAAAAAAEEAAEATAAAAAAAASAKNAAASIASRVEASASSPPRNLPLSQAPTTAAAPAVSIHLFDAEAAALPTAVPNAFTFGHEDAYDYSSLLVNTGLGLVTVEGVANAVLGACELLGRVTLRDSHLQHVVSRLVRASDLPDADLELLLRVVSSVFWCLAIGAAEAGEGVEEDEDDEDDEGEGSGEPRPPRASLAVPAIDLIAALSVLAAGNKSDKIKFLFRLYAEGEGAGEEGEGDAREGSSGDAADAALTRSQLWRLLKALLTTILVVGTGGTRRASAPSFSVYAVALMADAAAVETTAGVFVHAAALQALLAEPDAPEGAPVNLTALPSVTLGEFAEWYNVLQQEAGGATPHFLELLDARKWFKLLVAEGEEGGAGRPSLLPARATSTPAASAAVASVPEPVSVAPPPPLSRMAPAPPPPVPAAAAAASPAAFTYRPGPRPQLPSSRQPAAYDGSRAALLVPSDPDAGVGAAEGAAAQGDAADAAGAALDGESAAAAAGSAAGWRTGARGFRLPRSALQLHLYLQRVCGLGALSFVAVVETAKQQLLGGGGNSDAAPASLVGRLPNGPLIFTYDQYRAAVASVINAALAASSASAGSRPPTRTQASHLVWFFDRLFTALDPDGLGHVDARDVMVCLGMLCGGASFEDAALLYAAAPHGSPALPLPPAASRIRRGDLFRLLRTALVFLALFQELAAELDGAADALVSGGSETGSEASGGGPLALPAGRHFTFWTHAERQAAINKAADTYVKAVFEDRLPAVRAASVGGSPRSSEASPAPRRRASPGSEVASPASPASDGSGSGAASPPSPRSFSVAALGAVLAPAEEVLAACASAGAADEGAPVVAPLWHTLVSRFWSSLHVDDATWEEWLCDPAVPRPRVGASDESVDSWVQGRLADIDELVGEVLEVVTSGTWAGIVAADEERDAAGAVTVAAGLPLGSPSAAAGAAAAAAVSPMHGRAAPASAGGAPGASTSSTTSPRRVPLRTASGNVAIDPDAEVFGFRLVPATPLYLRVTAQDCACLTRLLGVSILEHISPEELCSLVLAVAQDGMITREAFADLVSRVLVPKPAQELGTEGRREAAWARAALGTFFNACDRTGVEAVPPTDLAVALLVLCGGSKGEKLEAAFALLDAKGAGELTQMELWRLLRCLLLGLLALKVAGDITPTRAGGCQPVPEPLTAVHHQALDRVAVEVVEDVVDFLTQLQLEMEDDEEEDDGEEGTASEGESSVDTQGFPLDEGGRAVRSVRRATAAARVRDALPVSFLDFADYYNVRGMGGATNSEEPRLTVEWLELLRVSKWPWVPPSVVATRRSLLFSAPQEAPAAAVPAASASAPPPAPGPVERSPVAARDATTAASDAPAAAERPGTAIPGPRRLRGAGAPLPPPPAAPQPAAAPATPASPPRASPPKQHTSAASTAAPSSGSPPPPGGVPITTRVFPDTSAVVYQFPMRAGSSGASTIGGIRITRDDVRTVQALYTIGGFAGVSTGRVYEAVGKEADENGYMSWAAFRRALVTLLEEPAAAAARGRVRPEETQWLLSCFRAIYDAYDYRDADEADAVELAVALSLFAQGSKAVKLSTAWQVAGRPAAPGCGVDSSAGPSTVLDSEALVSLMATVLTAVVAAAKAHLIAPYMVGAPGSERAALLHNYRSDGSVLAAAVGIARDITTSVPEDAHPGESGVAFGDCIAWYNADGSRQLRPGFVVAPALELLDIRKWLAQVDDDQSTAEDEEDEEEGDDEGGEEEENDSEDDDEDDEDDESDGDDDHGSGADADVEVFCFQLTHEGDLLRVTAKDVLAFRYLITASGFVNVPTQVVYQCVLDHAEDEGSGLISRTGFEAAVTEIAALAAAMRERVGGGAAVTDEDAYLVRTFLSHLFTAFDASRVGCVDAVEIAAALSLLTGEAKSPKLRVGFRAFDADGDGALTPAQFLALLRSLILPLSVFTHVDPVADAEDAEDEDEEGGHSGAPSASQLWDVAHRTAVQVTDLVFAAAGALSSDEDDERGAQGVGFGRLPFSSFQAWYNALGFQSVAYLELLNPAKWMPEEEDEEEAEEAEGSGQKPASPQAATGRPSVSSRHPVVAGFLLASPVSGQTGSTPAATRRQQPAYHGEGDGETDGERRDDDAADASPPRRLLEAFDMTTRAEAGGLGQEGREEGDLSYQYDDDEEDEEEEDAAALAPREPEYIYDDDEGEEDEESEGEEEEEGGSAAGDDTVVYAMELAPVAPGAPAQEDNMLVITAGDVRRFHTIAAASGLASLTDAGVLHAVMIQESDEDGAQDGEVFLDTLAELAGLEGGEEDIAARTPAQAALLSQALSSVYWGVCAVSGQSRAPAVDLATALSILVPGSKASKTLAGWAAYDADWDKRLTQAEVGAMMTAYLVGITALSKPGLAPPPTSAGGKVRLLHSADPALTVVPVAAVRAGGAALAATLVKWCAATSGKAAGSAPVSLHDLSHFYNELISGRILKGEAGLRPFGWLELISPAKWVAPEPGAASSASAAPNSGRPSVMAYPGDSARDSGRLSVAPAAAPAPGPSPLPSLSSPAAAPAPPALPADVRFEFAVGGSGGRLFITDADAKHMLDVAKRSGLAATAPLEVLRAFQTALTAAGGNESGEDGSSPSEAGISGRSRVTLPVFREAIRILIPGSALALQDQTFLSSALTSLYFACVAAAGVSESDDALEADAELDSSPMVADIVTALLLFAEGGKSLKLGVAFLLRDADDDGLLSVPEVASVLHAILVALFAARDPARIAGAALPSEATALDRLPVFCLDVAQSIASSSAGADGLVSLEALGQWYNAGGYNAAGFLELLNLSKWGAVGGTPSPAAPAPVPPPAPAPAPAPVPAPAPAPASTDDEDVLLVLPLSADGSSVARLTRTAASAVFAVSHDSGLGSVAFSDLLPVAHRALEPSSGASAATLLQALAALAPACGALAASPNSLVYAFFDGLLDAFGWGSSASAGGEEDDGDDGLTLRDELALAVTVLGNGGKSARASLWWYFLAVCASTAAPGLDVADTPLSRLDVWKFFRALLHLVAFAADQSFWGTGAATSAEAKAARRYVLDRFAVALTYRAMAWVKGARAAAAGLPAPADDEDDDASEEDTITFREWAAWYNSPQGSAEAPWFELLNIAKWDPAGAAGAAAAAAPAPAPAPVPEAPAPDAKAAAESAPSSSSPPAWLNRVIYQLRVGDEEGGEAGLDLVVTARDCVSMRATASLSKLEEADPAAVLATVLAHRDPAAADKLTLAGFFAAMRELVPAAQLGLSPRARGFLTDVFTAVFSTLAQPGKMMSAAAAGEQGASDSSLELEDAVSGLELATGLLLFTGGSKSVKLAALFSAWAAAEGGAPGAPVSRDGFRCMVRALLVSMFALTACSAGIAPLDLWTAVQEAAAELTAAVAGDAPTVSLEAFGAYYNTKGSEVAPYIELLSLSKWLSVEALRGE